MCSLVKESDEKEESTDVVPKRRWPWPYLDDEQRQFLSEYFKRRAQRAKARKKNNESTEPSVNSGKWLQQKRKMDISNEESLPINENPIPTPDGDVFEQTDSTKQSYIRNSLKDSSTVKSAEGTSSKTICKARRLKKKKYSNIFKGNVNDRNVFERLNSMRNPPEVNSTSKQEECRGKTSVDFASNTKRLESEDMGNVLKTLEDLKLTLK